jgi:dienelactone hydrolase
VIFSRAARLLPLFSLLAFAQDPVATARKAVDLMLAEKYQDMQSLFTPEVQKDLAPANLEKLGTQLKANGPHGTVGEPQVTKSGPNTIAVIPVKFGARTINFRMVVNGSGLVMGMFALPGAIEWNRPPYSTPDSFKEREVTVGEGEWKLPGTLTVPVGAGPFPAVVLVHGSGPSDRDETLGGTKVFKDLAEGLATRGIVVVRYEKRTKQYQSRVAALSRFTVGEETVDDASAAAALLRKQPEVNPAKVFVAGHSLGAYVAPRIADEDTKLAGLVLLAGNVRPMEDLVIEQLEAIGAAPGPITQAKAVQAKVKKLEPGDEDSPAVMGVPAAYWLDLKNYNPAEHAKKLAIPMLILQGERDYQVTMKDFALWKAAIGSSKNVTMKSYPALNHLFVAGEGKSLPAEYAKPGHVNVEVVDDIAAFLKK